MDTVGSAVGATVGALTTVGAASGALALKGVSLAASGVTTTIGVGASIMFPVLTSTVYLATLPGSLVLKLFGKK